MAFDELVLDIDKNQELINNFRPFDATYLPMVKDFYKIAVVWTSNTIEGFTYTEAQYLDSLKQIDQNGNDRGFVDFICRCEKETQKDFIRMLQLDKGTHT